MTALDACVGSSKIYLIPLPWLPCALKVVSILSVLSIDADCLDTLLCRKQVDV